jgi:hypothetical protein
MERPATGMLGINGGGELDTTWEVSLFAIWGGVDLGVLCMMLVMLGRPKAFVA